MKQKLMLLLCIAISAMLAGFLGCSGNSYGTNSPPSNIPPNTVVMRSESFFPNSMTIARGTTITWRNDDRETHTSTSDNTGWDTGDIPAGATRATTFNTAGTFAYHCTYHRAMGMVGSITVQ